MIEFDRWHAKCIQDRKVAAEIAEARAELKAKLETALLMHRLCHPKGKAQYNWRLLKWCKLLANIAVGLSPDLNMVEMPY